MKEIEHMSVDICMKSPERTRVLAACAEQAARLCQKLDATIAIAWTKVPSPAFLVLREADLKPNMDVLALLKPAHGERPRADLLAFVHDKKCRRPQGGECSCTPEIVTREIKEEKDGSPN